MKTFKEIVNNNNPRIMNLHTPTSNKDASTKEYFDTQISSSTDPTKKKFGHEKQKRVLQQKNMLTQLSPLFQRLMEADQ